MKVVIQRVTRASVTVEDRVTGKIDQGLLLLVGFGREDTSAVLAPVVEKIAAMRLFACGSQSFDKSVMDINGGVLIVSQFTLYADTLKGRRPDFIGALAPAEARQLYTEFVDIFRSKAGITIQTGEFGAMMKVDLENDGPVTILMDR